MGKAVDTSTRVLLIGSGGREHAIAWKLAQSDKVSHVYVAPGNAGIATENSKVSSVKNLNVNDFIILGDWCLENRISMVVVGPEDPLSVGIVDELMSRGIPTFGPRKAAAQIEASKHFAKSFMDRHQIPSAKWKSFRKPEEAKLFIQRADFPALVVKASGLAAGKGVIVALSKKEACEAVDTISESFGEASDTIIVEEVLEGEEVSVLAFCDGINVEVMLPSQDHKRLKENDQGPNTGGMGAYCPCPLLSDEQLEYVVENIIKKTVAGLKKEGMKYVGVLYAGLMITRDGPKVLEFNCRFGDPETQVIIPLMESDLYEVFEACVNGTLDKVSIKWIPNTYSVGVVLASAGYPGSYVKGKEITGVEDVKGTPGNMVFQAGTALSVDGKIITSGGRVLIAVSLGNELAVAAAKALKAAQSISFVGVQLRTDIARKGISRALLCKGSMTYKGSGVDIDAGDSLVKNIIALTHSTKRSGVMGDIGGFGGFFDLKDAGYKDPYLVSGTDGVGTKVKIAEETGIHDTVGIDLVAMCVNDILAHAAEPLYFLDYFACGKLEVDVATKVLVGITEGCRQAGCALIGGETAEMPGVYSKGCYDLAGFSVGAVERGRELPLKDKIAAGDIVLGLSSSGPHSNGYSLIRRVVEKLDLKYSDPCPFDPKGSKRTLGEALLTPTKIYVKAVLSALRSGHVKAFAHITGGGLSENIPRVLTKNLAVELDAKKWEIPPVFGWIAGGGGVNETEMLRTFNCGLGAIIIVSPAEQAHVLRMIPDDNIQVVGTVRDRFGDEPQVKVKHFAEVLSPLMKPHTHLSNGLSAKKRVGVLISGSGTNLQALIDHTTNPNVGSVAEIALVISNKSGVEGLRRAENAGIPTLVISHKDYPTREAFDDVMIQALEKANVEIVCLAGFMRIVSSEFVHHWRGRLINIHPSLLPSFKGGHAHELVLASGVRVTGCTVHFVEEEVDAGAIICQDTVPVEVNDDLSTLQERVKTVEHKAYPKALEMLARNKVKLAENGKIVWNL